MSKKVYSFSIKKDFLKREVTQKDTEHLLKFISDFIYFDTCVSDSGTTLQTFIAEAVFTESDDGNLLLNCEVEYERDFLTYLNLLLHLPTCGVRTINGTSFPKIQLAVYNVLREIGLIE